VVGKDAIAEARPRPDGSVLFAVHTSEQRDKLKAQLTAIDGCAVSGRLPRWETKGPAPCKGVIQGVAASLAMTTIERELSADGVVKATSLGRGTVVLTFAEGTELPRSVWLYVQHSVRAYVPTPPRCSKCLGFYHGESQCRGPVNCANCGQRGHKKAQCQNRIHCANCNSDQHRSGYFQCPAVLRAQSVITCMQTDRITLASAKAKVPPLEPIRSTTSAAASLPAGAHWGGTRRPPPPAATGLPIECRVTDRSQPRHPSSSYTAPAHSVADADILQRLTALEQTVQTLVVQLRQPQPPVASGPLSPSASTTDVSEPQSQVEVQLDALSDKIDRLWDYCLKLNDFIHKKFPSPAVDTASDLPQHESSSRSRSTSAASRRGHSSDRPASVTPSTSPSASRKSRRK